MREDCMLDTPRDGELDMLYGQVEVKNRGGIFFCVEQKRERTQRLKKNRKQT